MVETETKNSTNNVVREDVDVILISQTPVDETIYFLKFGKAKIVINMHSSQSLNLSTQAPTYTQWKTHILFLHAMTASATFKKREANISKKIQNRASASEILPSTIFCNNTKCC